MEATRLAVFCKNGSVSSVLRGTVREDLHDNGQRTSWHTSMEWTNDKLISSYHTSRKPLMNLLRVDPIDRDVYYVVCLDNHDWKRPIPETDMMTPVSYISYRLEVMKKEIEDKFEADRIQRQRITSIRIASLIYASGGQLSRGKANAKRTIPQDVSVDRNGDEGNGSGDDGDESENEADDDGNGDNENEEDEDGDDDGEDENETEDDGNGDDETEKDYGNDGDGDGGGGEGEGEY